MRHQFTEPTPVSRRGLRSVDVFVASWEIECCAPPPVMGFPSTWVLQFISAEQSYLPMLERDYTWLARPWPADTGQPPVATQLSEGPITAQWEGTDDEPPTGFVHLRGHLMGTVHGGISPDGFPRTTGLVHRIQVITQDFARTGGQYWEPIPSSATLTDVQRSPRWFNDHPPSQDRDRPRSQCVGVLLELAVAET